MGSGLGLGVGRRADCLVGRLVLGLGLDLARRWALVWTWACLEDVHSRWVKWAAML